MMRDEGQQHPRRQPILTAEGRDRHEQREGLLLSRARVLADLEAVQNPCHRALLEHTLAYINAELEATR